MISPLRYQADPNRYYIDASVMLTRLLPLPFVESKTIQEPSQIFSISVQPSGRRVLERLEVKIRTRGSDLYQFELGHFFGYGTHRLHPIVLLERGEIIEVIASLRQASRWWPRLVDRVWDWFKPPKVRVLLMGVVRKGEN